MSAGDTETVERRLRGVAEDDDGIGMAVALSTMLARTFAKDETVKVGRYALRHRSGAGGMGEVWAAHDPELDRTVAVKLLSGVTPSSVKREARALARLNHPCVVDVFEVGEYEGRLYLVMEFLEGPSMQTWLEQTRTWSEVLDVIERVAEALSYGHERGLVHRDVKPANVMLTEDGAKLVDFGIARVDGLSTATGAPLGADIDGLDQATSIAGTLPYMSPEQLDGDRATEKSDQFSLAVTAWQAMTGVLPFGGASFEARRAAIASGPRGVWPPGVPSGIKRALVRALSADSSRRFPSVAAMVQAMRRPGRGRWVAVGIVAAGLGLAGAALGGPADPAPPDCAALAQTKLDATLPGIAQRSEPPLSVLADYAAAWARASQLACAEPDAELADDVALCLADKLETVGRLHARVVDGTLDHQRAAVAFSRLPPPESCVVRGVSDLDRPPPQQREAFEDARRRWSDYQDKLLVGDHAPFADDLVVLRRDVEALQAPCLLAYVAIVQAMNCIADQDPTCSIAHLETALESGETCGHPQPVMQASSMLIRVYGEFKHDMERAEFYARHARSVMERLEPTPLITSSFHAAMAELRAAQGRSAEVVEHARQALAGAESISAYSGAQQRLNYAVALSRVGEHELAYREGQRALATIAAELGPEHPELVLAYINFGVVQAIAGRLTQAKAQFEHGYAIAAKTLGEKHGLTAALVHNMGEVYLDLGDAEQAREWAQRARTLRDGLFELGAPWRVETVELLVRIEDEAGDAKAGLPLQLALVDELQASGPSRAPSIAQMLLKIAGTHRALGDDGAARATLRQLTPWLDEPGVDPAVATTAATLKAELAAQ